MKPTPLSAVLADDLLLDRIGARQDTDDELGSLLLAVAHRADVPVPSAAPVRRGRRHRGLTVLAALGVAVSGATVAAAVELAPLAPDQASGRVHRAFLPPSVQALVAPSLAGSPFQGRLVLPYGVAASSGSPSATSGVPAAGAVVGAVEAVPSATPPGAAGAGGQQAPSDPQQRGAGPADAITDTTADTKADTSPDTAAAGTSAGSHGVASGSAGQGSDNGTPSGTRTGGGSTSAASAPAAQPTGTGATPPNQANHGTVATAEPGKGVTTGQANGITAGNGQAKGRVTGSPVATGGTTTDHGKAGSESGGQGQAKKTDPPADGGATGSDAKAKKGADAGAPSTSTTPTGSSTDGPGVSGTAEARP